MKCPECKKEISYVRVYSECWQKGHLKENRIEKYSPVNTENIGYDITGIGCPECGEDIGKYIDIGV